MKRIFSTHFFLPNSTVYWVYTLLFPALISGCAHAPHTASTSATPASPPSTTSADNRHPLVLRVGPSAYRSLDNSTNGQTASPTSPSSPVVIAHPSQSKKMIVVSPPPSALSPALSPLSLIPSPSPIAAISNAVSPVVDQKTIILSDKRKLGTKKNVKRGKKTESAQSVVRKEPYLRVSHWDSVREHLLLSGVEHDRVNAEIERFRNRPGAVDFLMKRAEPYLPYLLEEIKQQGLPTDLIIVPMVESAFESTALSPKQAAGIWQFIPTTGQQYGLEVGETYDARYDVQAATQAACKYLRHLNKLFNGDWMLAFAAYNAGEGTVHRAIASAQKAGLSSTFWDLDLPAETEAYVLRIISLARMISTPENYGVKPRKNVDSTYLIRVGITSETVISDLVTLCGMAPEEFYKLNPAFKPEVQMVSKPHTLLLPLDKAHSAATYVPGVTIHSSHKVVVKKGETLALLAKRHGIPEIKLAEWNHLKPKTPLKAGQELVVYPV